MKIDTFKTEKNKERIKVSAKIQWEDCNRSPQVVFFETDKNFSDVFSCNPHAFIVGCILPAMRFGEKRIFMDAEICPDLRDGLITVMSWMRQWGRYKPEQELIRIEAKKLSKPGIPSLPGRAAFFFSGGIDSLATLTTNHLNYPVEHPGYIREGLVVCGWEVYEEDKFAHVLRSVSEIARDAGITLIPVHTNLRNVGPEGGAFWSDFWSPEYQGAGFASIAHTFSKRFSTVYLSSDDDIPNILFPYGNHPLINPNYSSSDLSFKLVGITLTRFEKMKLIASWDTAIQHLRVCNESSLYHSGVLNCGECEKCVRTKLGLLALGVLDKNLAFANSDISPKFVKTALQLDDHLMTEYGKDLMHALAERGHHELVSIINRKIKIVKLKKIVRKPTIDIVKEFDRKYLNGNILKLKRSFYKKGVLK